MRYVSQSVKQSGSKQWMSQASVRLASISLRSSCMRASYQKRKKFFQSRTLSISFFRSCQNYRAQTSCFAQRRTNSSLNRSVGWRRTPGSMTRWSTRTSRFCRPHQKSSLWAHTSTRSFRTWQRLKTQPSCAACLKRKRLISKFAGFSSQSTSSKVTGCFLRSRHTKTLPGW